MNVAKKTSAKPAAQKSEAAKPSVVGIGASAGGLAALKQFFALVPADSGLVFVVVVHLSPEHKSHLADLLQPSVRFPVRQVTDTISLEPNNVYVIPPNANLSAIDTHLRLSSLEKNRRERAPIDHFFRTLAKTHDGHSIGVILTGTGSDGTLGLREVKAKGGVILVQDPNEAEFDGMPQSAIATGLVDRVLPIADIPEVLMRLATVEPKLKRATESKDSIAAERILLPKVLAILKTRTDRDFSRYKPATLLRRIARRMQLNYLDNFEAYLDKLREQPDEARALADDLLINVTSFFRDPEIFLKLQSEAIPHLFEGKGASDSIRVWSVGCATGEEAYSLAMVLLEEAARHAAPPNIQIFASDLHKRSLNSAREGLYPGDIQADVSPERLNRFFLQENGGYRICREVRDLVVFAPHNLLSDPPFSRLDLIACRNLLIYLERGVQRDVTDLFHYALCANGYLFLGSAETIDASELFRTEDKKLCIYRKRNVPAPEPRLPVFPLTRFRGATETLQRSERAAANLPYQALHHNLLERFAPPSILIGPDNQLVHLSEQAGRYLVHPGGETTLSALRLVREELRIALQSLLQAARDEKHILDSQPIPVRFNGHSTPVVMHVRPAQDADQDGFVLVIFEDQESQPAAAHNPAAEADPADGSGQLSRRTRELQAELNTARQQLQATIEEYETSREEMKASQEEMQSTNEELRSTMEELETSKEELQSINEELQTVNQENRHKVDELSQLSGDLQNLLSSTDIATLFLDRDFRILRFTPRLAGLFNIRVTDRGRPISDLTHRLGYGQLQEDARLVLERLVPIEREIRDDADRWYLTRVLPYRSTDDRIEGVVITFVDITPRKQAEEAFRESEQLRRVALAGGRMGTWRWNLKDRLVSGDARFFDMWGFPASSEPIPLAIFIERMSAEGSGDMETIVRRAIEGGEEFDGPIEIVSGPKAGHWVRWRGHATAGDTSMLYGVSFDITEQRQADRLLRESEENQRRLLEGMPQLVWRSKNDGYWTWSSPQWQGFTGQSMKQSQAQGWLDVLHPDDVETALRAWAGARAAGMLEVDYRIRQEITGQYRWHHTRAVPIRDKDGTIAEWLGTSTDIEDLKRAEAARQSIEKQFRLFVDNVQEYGLVQTDVAGLITNWNPGAERMFGFTPVEMIGKDFAVLMTAEDQAADVFQHELAHVSGGQRLEDARWFVRKDGSRFWARWITEPIHDGGGAFLGLAKIMRDETERERSAAFTKTALAEKEELLKEVHHRVKNNLQVITSLLNLQADQIGNKQTLVTFDEARNRVAAIAAIHEILYRSSSFSAIHLADYARSFAPSLVEFYGAQGRVEIAIIGDGVTLELERAVPYGLLLNELLSNALKHAFAGEREGRIVISFARAGGTGTLSVVDDGVGLASGFEIDKVTSLGLKLVRNLARQLRGEVSFRDADPGTAFEVQFPIAHS